MRWLVLVLAACLGLGACGGDDDGPTFAGNETTTDTSVQGDDGQDEGDEAGAAAEDLAEDLTAELEEQQAASGGGSATLVVGDQQWLFDSVLCAFGEDQIGQEGAEFVLSSIQNGLQMYASVDSFGHLISLDDIEDFENPSVSLSSTGDAKISVDGKNVLFEGEFLDGTTDSFDSVTGTFSAICP